LKPAPKPATLPAMPNRPPPQIDMLIDGTFRMPRRPSLPLRIAGVALLVAVLAGGLAVAVLALWLLAALIPIAVVAGVIAWAAIRFQLWRSRRSWGSRDVFRP
jgi:hypothetical protein